MSLGSLIPGVVLDPDVQERDPRTVEWPVVEDHVRSSTIPAFHSWGGIVTRRTISGLSRTAASTIGTATATGAVPATTISFAGLRLRNVEAQVEDDALGERRCLHEGTRAAQPQLLGVEGGKEHGVWRGGAVRR